VKKKRVLFVCTANYYRSITGERIYKEREDLEVQSAGTFPFAERVVNSELINWADIIFAMEHHHKDDLLRLVPEADDKIIVLEIPDIFQRMDPVLIKLLKERVNPYLK